MTGIPGYTLLRELGQGGMATVHLAIQESLGREVALKRLAPAGGDADGVAAERFLREARIAASLHHPHILPIHDFGVHDGVPYLAMEYEAGGTIAPLAGEKLAPREALRLVRDVASALDYAHARGIVHRDIKPDNILRRADGGAMLSDFGIARLMQGDSALTTEGTSVGTPHYMSPEQLRGEKVDGRSDLYGLGVVLWQLLTGELPYSGADAWSIGTQHLTADIPRLPAPLAHLQPLLDALLAKSPAARVPSGADLVQRIDALLIASTMPPQAQATVAIPSTRPRRALPALALVAVLALLGLGWWGWQATRIDEPSAAARAAVGAGTVPAAAAPAADESIAVMPFEDLSPAHDQVYFAAGIAEELQSRLSQVQGLKVAGRASSRAFSGKDATVAQIGKALAVRHVLEGTVRKEGDRLRVTVQLSDVATGFQRWSQRYDRELTDVFAVQDEIAGAVVDALRLRLVVPGEDALARRHVPSFAAYDAYLAGREALARPDATAVDRAMAAYRKAVALDPLYAPAWSGLAMAEGFTSERSSSTPSARAAARARAMAAAERAVALDPGLGDAYAARGYLRTDAWDWQGALSDTRRAVALAPRDGRNQMRYAYLLAVLGRLDEARAALEAGTRADPHLLPAWQRLAITTFAQGDLAATRAALDRIDVIEPGTQFTPYFRGLLTLLEGNGEAARPQLEAVHDPLGALMARHTAGDRAGAWRDLQARISTAGPDQDYSIAQACAWMQQPDCAFARLGALVDRHEHDVLAIPYDPLFRNLRGDPRFTALLARMDLPVGP